MIRFSEGRTRERFISISMFLCNLSLCACDYIYESAFIHREHSMKDQKILNRLKNGDASALDELMKTYTPYLSVVVWNMLRGKMSVQDAEEVVSDVFVAAWQQADEIKSDSLKGWLAAVARNKALNKLREKGKDVPLENEYLYLNDTFACMNRTDEKMIIKTAINRLKKKEREVLVRHYYFFQSIKEISRDMRLNESTVKSHLRRGRIHLKKYLNGEEETDEKEND